MLRLNRANEIFFAGFIYSSEFKLRVKPVLKLNPFTIVTPPGFIFSSKFMFRFRKTGFKTKPRQRSKIPDRARSLKPKLRQINFRNLLIRLC